MAIVSDILQATPAPADGSPTPARTWQWLRDGAAITSATSSAYTTVDADANRLIAVRQTETNFMGAASATSIAFATVDPFEVRAALFSTSEPGVWLDPSDTSTMFQDSVGTTPVTATGQTVGLLLDKSKGLALGPELWVTPTLSGTSWAWAGSTLTGLGVAAGTATSNASIAGLFYRVTFTVGPTGSGLFQVRVGDTFLATLAGGANTTYTYIAQAGNTSGLRFTSSGGTTGTVSNISVKELVGNHLTQATAASRPIYGIEPFGGRRNLLVNSENFNTTSWTTRLADATLTYGVADPFGGTNAATLTGTGAIPRTSFNPGFTFPSGTAVVTSVWLRRRSGAGTVSIYNSGVSQSASTVVTLTSSWQRFEVSATISYTGTQTPGIVLGTNGDAVDFFGFQFELGSLATAYQRVTDQWNVTEAGKASVSYLAFDGTDDFLVSPTITPGIDKAQVFAGVRKLSDAASGMVAELSTSWASNAGTLFLHAPESSGTGAYSGGSRGAAGLQLTQRVVFNSTAPDTRVVTFTHDISGDLTVGRMDGVQQGTATGDKGTGNFLAYPLYVGRRGGTSLPFNGRIYQMIVRFGTNLSATRIARTEQFISEKTGIYTLQQLNQFTVLDASGVSYSAYAASDATNNNYLVPKTVLNADGTSYLI